MISASADELMRSAKFGKIKKRVRETPTRFNFALLHIFSLSRMLIYHSVFLLNHV